MQHFLDWILEFCQRKYWKYVWLSSTFSSICRADHNLQDLRAKIFPSKTKKDNKVHDTVSSAPLQAKQKKRSLSSLGVTAPRASVLPFMSGRRKYPARKTLIPRESALPFEEPAIKVEGCLEKFSSPETKNKIATNVKLVATQRICKFLWINTRLSPNTKHTKKHAPIGRKLFCIIYWML